MWKGDLRGIYWIEVKDMKTYYLKPPAISWDCFPLSLDTGFLLEKPSRLRGAGIWTSCSNHPFQHHGC